MDIKPDKVSQWKMKRTMDDLWEERGQVLPDGKDQRARLEKTAPLNDIGDSFEKYALKDIECSTLTKLYFSPENRQEIQNRIRYTIYRQSRRRYIIDEQNNMELAILMRSIYLQHSKNLNCQFKKQIKELNDIVVDAIIPGLMSNIKQYITYLRDKSQPLQPLDRPKNTNTTGTKSLRTDRMLGPL
jgi:hypothetical protein